MADLFFNISDQAELFNEFLAKGVVAEWKGISKLFDMCKKSWKNFNVEGKFWKQRISLSGSQSFGARSDAGYPESQQGRVDKTIVYAKRAEMFSLGFDGMALEAARGQGAVIKPVEFEKEEQYKEIADDISRQLVGDGSGKIAQCKGASGGTPNTLVIDSPYFTHPSMFFKPGRVIDIYQADLTTKEVEGAKIASIDYDTDTLTLVAADPAHSWTDDSWVLSTKAVTATEGGGLGEMMGLLGIISKTNPPIPNASLGLQQLLVAGYPEWKAQVFDGGGVARDLVEDLFIQPLQRTERFGQVSVILVSPGVYRAWFSILSAYKGIVNDKKLWGGWTGLPFFYNGREIPVVMEEFVPNGCALFLSEKNLELHVLTPGMITWEQGASGILQKVANYNQYKAEGHFFGNLGTSLRPAFALLKDIKEPD